MSSADDNRQQHTVDSVVLTQAAMIALSTKMKLPPLTYSDLDTCQIDSWLNETVVHFFAKMVQRHYNSDSYCFDPLLLTEMMNESKDIQEIAGRQMFQDVNFVQKTALFFPLTVGATPQSGGGHHYVLFEVDPTSPDHLSCYDSDERYTRCSSMSSIDGHVQNILKFLRYLLPRTSGQNSVGGCQQQTNTNDCELWSQHDCPQQTNGSDCGVYLLNNLFLDI